MIEASGPMPADARRWVTTWARTPSTPALDARLGVPRSAAQVFGDQTLRVNARASVGGEAVRIRLSNLADGAAVLFGAAHVALRSRGEEVVAGTDRVLTFGGLAAATIPACASVVSDPVDLVVPPLAELAVSLYLPRATEGSTVHVAGTDTNYVLDGDQCGAIAPVVRAATCSVHFLAGVEVLAPRDTRLVVCLGDSLTDGVGSTPDAHRTWPERLAERLAGAGEPSGVVNHGYAGNRLLRDGAAHGALARFERDVLASCGVTDVIVFAGINDLAPSDPAEDASAADVSAAHRRLIERAHGAGLRIHAATLTPFAGCSVFTPGRELQRQAVNDFIRGCGELDGIFDFEAAVTDGSNPPRLPPWHDAGDQVHLTDAGYEALANAVDLRALAGPRGRERGFTRR